MSSVIELDRKSIQTAYDRDYYTILGAGGDVREWTDGYEGLCEREGIGAISQWYHTTGKEVNARWNLGGDDAFKDDLNILFFPHDGLDVGKLAILKIKMCDRWFRDVIDNSLAHMEEEQED